MKRLRAGLAVSVFVCTLAGECWAQGEGIGTLPKTKPFLVTPSSSVQSKAPVSDIDHDGLIDIFEIVTLQTDPFVPDIVAMTVSPLAPQSFRLLVYSPQSKELRITGQIPFANLEAVTGQAPPSALSASGVQSHAAKSGLIYRPIKPQTQNPPLANQLCVQGTIVVGQSGATQLLLIESSSCQPGPSSCSASCPNEVGNVIEVMDPLALIGG